MVGVAAQPIVKYFENHPYNMIMGIPRLSKEATSLLLLRSTMSKKKKKKKKGKLISVPKDNFHSPTIGMNKSNG